MNKKYYLLLFLTISILSCKNEIEKRIEAINIINDSLSNSIPSITKIQDIDLFEARIKSLRDSIHTIMKDKNLKEDYLNKTKSKFKIVENLFNEKKQIIIDQYTSKIIQGKYVGSGVFYAYVENWGNVPIGVIFTKFDMFDNGSIDLKFLSSSRGKWEYEELVISNCSIINDTFIKGDFIDKKGGVKCHFEWSPKVINLKGSKWGSKNKIEKSEHKSTNGSSESAMVEKTAKVTTSPSVSEPKDKLVKNKVNTSAKSVSSVSGKYSEASEKLFTKAELSKYNNSKLRLIRNEIFARHGYIFKAKDLSDYFNKQEWYRPKFKDVMSKLTSIEKKNIALIETFENK